MRALQDRGWQAEGVDLNPGAVQLVRELGAHVLEGTVEDAELPPESFDAVICWHMLEQVWHPAPFLKVLRRLVRCDALLFVQVPDFDQLPAYESQGRAAHLLSRVHANFFNAATLTRLLDRNGWLTRSIFFDTSNGFLTAVAQPS